MLGATVLQNVKNSVQHPPMTPPDIAAGLRKQIPYLVKWLFRKLHAELLSSAPDQESYNLNTHSGDSFYAAFPAAEASRLNDRIHWVHTPKHGSWLNVAELEFSALHRQCLDRRIESRALVTSATAAWAEERNREQTGVDWQFSDDGARIKLKYLYPKIKTS